MPQRLIILCDGRNIRGDVVAVDLDVNLWQVSVRKVEGPYSDTDICTDSPVMFLSFLDHEGTYIRMSTRETRPVYLNSGVNERPRIATIDLSPIRPRYTPEGHFRW